MHSGGIPTEGSISPLLTAIDVANLPNATLDGVNAEVIHQASTQLGELLTELKGIEVGRTTLRRILVGAPATPLESPFW